MANVCTKMQAECVLYFYFIYFLFLLSVELLSAYWALLMLRRNSKYLPLLNLLLEPVCVCVCLCIYIAYMCIYIQYMEWRNGWRNFSLLFCGKLKV